MLMIRHGETPVHDRNPGPTRSHGDPDLTPHGRCQAATVANRLAIGPDAIAAVYSTPLHRAVQTAEPIAEALGLPMACELPAPEYAGEGRPRCEWVRQMGEHIDELAVRHRGEIVVLVCHKASIVAAENYFQQGPCEHIEIAADPASITEWEHHPAADRLGGRWQRRRHNDIAHRYLDIF